MQGLVKVYLKWRKIKKRLRENSTTYIYTASTAINLKRLVKKCSGKKEEDELLAVKKKKWLQGANEWREKKVQKKGYKQS